MILKATIFGTPEQSQIVWVECEYIPIEESLYQDFFRVNFCRILTPLSFVPSDLSLDMEIAIAEALGEDPRVIRIDCEIEQEVDEMEMMFV